jgi:hypothetical protein
MLESVAKMYLVKRLKIKLPQILPQMKREYCKSLIFNTLCAKK